LSRGDLFVVSGASGTGKTTLIRRLLAGTAGLEFSVSYTTRPPREGEREGVDYHFVDERRFERMKQEGDLLEWARVHDHHYGTGATAVEKALDAGRDVLLDIDTQGATSVRRARGEAVLVFILPPDARTLRERITGRNLEPAEVIERRIGNARAEIDRCLDYDFVVVNDDADRALAALAAIVGAHRSRRQRMEPECRRIMASFRHDGTTSD